MEEVIKTQVNFTKKERIGLFEIEAGMTSLVESIFTALI